MPRFGLLCHERDYDREKRLLDIWEVRVCSGAYAMRDWHDPSHEPALLVTGITFRASKRECLLSNDVLCVLSMHGLARWLQRNFDDSTEHLWRDLAAIGRDHAALLAASRPAPHRWSCSVEAGRWVGSALNDRGKPLLAAHSFYDPLPEPDDIRPLQRQGSACLGSCRG
jgi:hypothetical protein